MSLVNYKVARERFDHIDARFVDFHWDMSRREATLTVDLYPWWEHPRVLEARSKGEKWGAIQGAEEAFKPVAVHARQVHEARIFASEDVIDWEFLESHPLLWPYEDVVDLVVNAPMPVEAVFAVAQGAGSSLGVREISQVLDCLDLGNFQRYGSKGSFSLGRLPRSVFIAVREQFDLRGIPYYAAREPANRDLPVLFLLDGEDYVIADDFELDVPEFIHKDEWFRP